MVAGNSDAVTLSGLKADTQYQLTVAAVWGGKKYRSRPIVFRTLGKATECAQGRRAELITGINLHSLEVSEWKWRDFHSFKRSFEEKRACGA